MSYIESFKQLEIDLKEIKQKGFVLCTRPNNKDGGIGNTLEDLLNIQENNLQQFDYLDYEIKSQRTLTNSPITLFSMASKNLSNTAIRNNRRLHTNYGRIDIDDEVHRLYWTVTMSRTSNLYEHYDCKLIFDNDVEPKYLILEITDKRTKAVDKDTYWDLNVIQNKIKGKLKNLVFCQADEKKVNDQRYFNFNYFECYFDFNFKNFISALKSGDIQVDFRIGADLNGNNAGKYHDHGTGFRINRNKLSTLYDTFVVI